MNRIHELRAEYERLVVGLGAKIQGLRATGLDDEAIARALHAERRALTVRFKQETPECLRSVLDERTMRRYGNPIGPTIEDLRRSGKSWIQIIESASRPGRCRCPSRREALCTMPSHQV